MKKKNKKNLKVKYIDHDPVKMINLLSKKINRYINIK